MFAPQQPRWPAADRQIPEPHHWAFLDDQVADHATALATVGLVGGLDADDDAVLCTAQLDDPEVFEIEQTLQVNIFHRLLRIGVDNDHAKPREAPGQPVGGRPDRARSTRPEH